MSNEVVYKISQINDYIKRIIDSETILHNISMYGEVSGASISGGNIYFSLKDENALISCISFGTKFSEFIKNGNQVIIVGTIRYYSKGGKVTVTVIDCKPYGIGELYQKFIEMKNKLESEGLFDVSHKKQVPKYVERIGVVTSSTGAVIQDIINITTRRNDSIDIVVYPVKVQGVGAEEQIAKGIDFFSKYDNVDIVIVARGGGSFEDLMPFNTEIVARSTYNCEKPIISAVGHETDFSIIDFVADLRAPTPSAAAELCVLDRDAELNRVKYNINRIANHINLLYNNNAQKLKNNIGKIVNYFDTKIKLNINNLIMNYKVLYNQVNTKIINMANALISCEKIVNAYNPKNVLDKGYSIIKYDNKIISDFNQFSIGQKVDVVVKNGKLKVEVIEKENSNE